MSTFLQDLRFALRGLAKQRGFTLVALLTLALGIGANTAIFGIVNAVLLRPLPYQDPDRVVLLWSHWINWSKTWVSQGELVDYQEQSRSLEHVAAFSATSFNLTGGGDPCASAPRRCSRRSSPRSARSRSPDACSPRPKIVPGHEHVVMLTEGLWRTQFGSDPSIVGRAIQLDAEPYTVVGVLPASLRLPLDYASRTFTQIWVPLALGPNDPQQRGNHGLNALGRLRAGVPLAQAQAEIDTITRGFQQNYPNNYDREFGLTLVTAPSEVFGDVRPALVVLLMAVGAVLLIACANVANLLLARSEARQKELAIRVVLGAGRGRIVRQLLTESMVLSALGGAAGVALAYGLTRGLIALDPLKIPRVQDIAIDGRVLAFTGAIAFAHRHPVRHRAGDPVVARRSAAGAEGRRARLARRHGMAAPHPGGRRGRRLGRAGGRRSAAGAELRAPARRRRRFQSRARADAAHVAPVHHLHQRRRRGPRVCGGRTPVARVAGRAVGRRGHRSAAGHDPGRLGHPHRRPARADRSHQHRGGLAGRHPRLFRGDRHAAQGGTRVHRRRRRGHAAGDRRQRDDGEEILAGRQSGRPADDDGRQRRLADGRRRRRRTCTIAGSTCCRGPRCIGRTHSSATATHPRRRSPRSPGCCARRPIHWRPPATRAPRSMRWTRASASPTWRRWNR